MEEEKKSTKLEKKENYEEELAKRHIIEEAGNTMTRSRLRTHAKNNILLYILGVIALLIFFAFFGIQLLVNFSLFVGNFREESDQPSTGGERDQTFIPKPVVSQPQKATKEPKTDIEGMAKNAKTVELFVNDSLTDKRSVHGEDFTFNNVPLKEGENRIKARSVNGKNKSEFSETVKVVYRQKAPELDIETPKDGDAFSGGVSLLKVKGHTEPYAKVTINGAQAIMDDTGTFRFDYRMQSGENKLLVVVTDETDNKTEKEVKFTYSP